MAERILRLISNHIKGNGARNAGSHESELQRRFRSPRDCLLRPDVAVKQREDEQPAVEPPGPKPGTGTGPGTDPGPGPGGQGAPTTRFYGVKTLSSDKIAMDFRNIPDEVIANLRDQGIDLVVKIEIEAVNLNGFDENRIRTVSENAKTLKFDQSGFESV